MYKFEKLRVWKKAMDFCENIYRSSSSFPKEEMFGLTSQIRRSAASIPINIAEGSASDTDKEFRRFLRIALKSQFEVVTILELSHRLGYIENDTYKELREECDNIGKSLHSLIKTLHREKKVT